MNESRRWFLRAVAGMAGAIAASTVPLPIDAGPVAWPTGTSTTTLPPTTPTPTPQWNGDGWRWDRDRMAWERTKP